MNNSSQQQIDIRDLKVIKTLPPMPDIYFKIEKLANDPNSTSADYSKVLELDVNITANILRISNSAFFSFRRKIRSVKNAVTLLGKGEILSLVRLSYITGNLNVSPIIEHAVRKIWEHSATCAIIANLISDKTNLCIETEDKNNLFTGGIIHDIGKIVLWKFFPTIYTSFLINPAIGPHQSENEESHVRSFDIYEISYGEVLSPLVIRGTEVIGILGNALPKSFLLYSTLVTQVQILVFFLFAIFLVMVLGAVISRIVSDPLMQLVQASKTVASGDYSVSINAFTGDEIEILANTFNTMVSSMRSSKEEILDAYD